ncbi:MAG TPA: outer membrane protein assembly factor BamA [Clostridia bacterium]|nr:outer membrane protein assembly factor BamA [Clostridia bacterium]
MFARGILGCWLLAGCLTGTTAGQTQTAPGTSAAGVSAAKNPPARTDVAPNLPSPAADAVAKPPNLGALSQFQGLIVSGIEFRGLHSSIAEPQIRRLLRQSTGEPLDRNKLRDSIKELYATGRFSNLQIEGERKPDRTITLVFVATENFFNGDVEVHGRPRHGPSETQFINASKLRLGELYTRDKVTAGIAAMQRLLEDYGFYRAQITYDENPHPDAQQMNIVFHVNAGEAARIGDVTVSGTPGLTVDEIRRIAKLKSGEPVRNNVVPRALQRLRNHYTKQDRLEAEIVLLARKYNEAGNKVDYDFRIERGPTIDIHTEGFKIGRGRLRRYVPVFEENAVDEDLLNEGRRNIRDYLQTDGYFEATVQVAQKAEPKDDHVHVIYEIDRGARHELTGIVIRGNKFFRTEDLRERMIMQEAGILLSHGRFSQGILNNDLAAIRNLYEANGFQQVKVTHEIIHGDDAEMQVVLNIDEGPQTRVENLKIVGNKAIGSDELRSMLQTIEGQAYSDTGVAADRDAVVNTYFNRGFPDVSMESTAAFHENDKTRMDVTYTITEGDRVFVDRVLVSGTQYTKPHIINREFEIRDGAPLSQDAMIESQRRLYDLGIFTSVDMAVQNDEGEARYKNLLYNIKEARRWTLNYGLGVEIGTGADVGQGTGAQGDNGISPRVSFDVTRINFRGRGQSLLFKSRYGRFSKRALLSFDAPKWFEFPNWRMTLTAFYDDSRDVNTFASERLEGSAQLTQVVSKATQMLYRFSYRRVRVDPNSFPAGFSPELIPIYSRPVRVGMPSLTYIRDRRDDPTNASSGSYNTADLGVAAGYFGSEANFGRVLVQNATFHPFGKRKGYVFARSTRIGVEAPFGSDLTASVNGSGPSTNIPLPERFFVGGGNSHRGFAINQAGPRDPSTGGPVGGNAMFVNNLELRLPPTPLPFVQENLSFVVFHDMGNAFGDPSDMWSNLLRFKQKDPDQCRNLDPAATCDLNYVSHAIGAGVRYRTPIGPIRLDFGYNLNPPVFPIKQASTGVVPHSETVRRFNFFFSIGQTF